MKQSFDEWYESLKSIAFIHGESVADRAAWRECYDKGESVEAAFFDEYPEHEQ